MKSASDKFAMRCMEIRGGNRVVQEVFETPGLDVWLSSTPHESAANGGDVYYVSVCGGGIITRVVVADVSGHGAHVSGFSATLRDLMRKNINTKSQTRLVRALNREFGRAAEAGRFATAVVATYLATKKTLTICNAGHPRPLWYRASRREWVWLDKDLVGDGNLPLGLDEDSPYHQFTVPLGLGDAVLVYTDALTEAADATGKLLGEDGLLKLVEALDLAAPHDFSHSLLAAIGRHRGDLPSDDDVTLLTLVHNARGPHPPSLTEKLDVYAKVFGIKSY